MRFLHAIVLFALIQGCAGAETPTPVTPADKRAQAASRNLEIGDAMETRGHHLEASFYYEAALILAAEEPSVLPKLIAAQVRAGRLRAASVNTQRLIALVGPQPELMQLSKLLTVYAPPLSQDSTVVTP